MARIKKTFLKQLNYPRFHSEELRVALGMKNGGTKENKTALQTVQYDEGIAGATSYNNPEHSSFGEVNEPNMYPNSKITDYFHMAEFSLTKSARSADIVNLKVGVLTTYLNYEADYTPTEEGTAETVADILNILTESTDRQAYINYNGNKLDGDIKGLGTNVLDLTTNQNIEGVNIDIDKYYDALQYYTIGNKIRAKSFITWKYITDKRPARFVFDRLPSNVRRVNEYCSVIHNYIVPDSLEERQIGIDSDFTDINHVALNVIHRCLEWNATSKFYSEAV